MTEHKLGYEDFYNAVSKRTIVKYRSFLLDNAMEYFEAMDFDLKKMNWKTLNQFLSTKTMSGLDEYHTANFISNILDRDFEHGIMRRRAKILREEIYNNHDFSYDRQFFISNTEWEDFVRIISERLSQDKANSATARNFIVAAIAWEYPCKKRVNDITVGDIEKTETGILIAGSELVGAMYHTCYELLEGRKKGAMLKGSTPKSPLRYTDVQFSREIFERSIGHGYMCKHDEETEYYLDRMTVEVYDVQL